MRAGSLRHRIAFDAAQPAVDESGAPVQVFAEQFRAWCSITALSPKQAADASQTIGTVDCKITVRWRPDTDLIRATWRAQRVDRAGVRVGPIYALTPPTEVDFAGRQIDILATSGAIGG